MKCVRRFKPLANDATFGQLTLETIAGGDLSAEDASRMIAETRNVALNMFPGKENAFDLLYRPKFQRMMHAVYRLQ